MSKKVALPRKSSMHFEKVPVAEVIRKIGSGEITNDRGKAIRDGTVEPQPRPRVRTGSSHGVQFYNDPDALSRIVGGFVGEGLEQGSPALLIATPDHADRIDHCFRARGIDVDSLKRQGCLVTLDARTTLQLFMVDGMPNPGAFRRVISSALANVRRGRDQGTIRAYGEMVDLLWKDGLEEAAIRLETLWNQLGSNRDFKLLCGYSMGNFYKGTAIADIYDQHSHLIPGNGDATPFPDLRAGAATPS
jgi:hypothetical protein